VICSKLQSVSLANVSLLVGTWRDRYRENPALAKPVVLQSHQPVDVLSSLAVGSSVVRPRRHSGKAATEMETALLLLDSQDYPRQKDAPQKRHAELLVVNRLRYSSLAQEQT
jgi:hypothetical protein